MPPDATKDNADDSEDLKPLILRVFKSVWKDFHAWQEQFCSKQINSLQGCPHWQEQVTQSTSISCARASDEDIANDALDASIGISTDDNEEVFLYCSHSDSDSATQHSRRVVAETINAELPFDGPYPQYESTTQVNRSIFVGDNSNHMPFLPFADDPTFSHGEYQMHYDFLSWQDDPLDPDIVAIVTETADRLHEGYNLSFEMIDATGVLPLPLLDRLGTHGVLSSRYSHDYINWPGRKKNLPSTANQYNNSPTSLRDRISRTLRYFCPNLNCIEPYCPIHYENFPMPFPKVPHLRGRNLEEAAAEKGPCGDGCFLWIDEQSHDKESWSKSDIEDLRTILELTPDLSPCELAILCRKKCNEIYGLRQRLLSDSTIQPEEHQNLTLYAPITDPTALSLFKTSLATPPNHPCHHTGPCAAYTSNDTVTSSCACALNNGPCERNCHCSLDCNRRWHGCACVDAGNGKTCSTDRCPCVRTGRECDPELCRTCDARDCSKETSCRNTQIQRGVQKRSVVKQSQNGLGLGMFLDEYARIGDLIAEYTGEIIYEPTVLSRSDLADHRKRNYVFELNKTFTIDGTYAGNATRFINHASKRFNCRALVKLVNGEHRIGIYAIKSITPGTELKFDYGPHFFPDKT